MGKYHQQLAHSRCWCSFQACAAEALQNVWTGINSTIMCYGQTGESFY